ncbi:MAG: hypothetical protein AAGJ83_05490 [Planctomycetota bacterium]
MQLFFFLLLILLLLAKVIVFVLGGLTEVPEAAVDWWELGTRVAQGDWALRPVGDEPWEPLYPWLIGLLQRTCSRPLLALVCLQAFLWTATMIIVSSIVGQLSRRPAAPFLAIAASLTLVTSLVWATAVTPTSLLGFLLVVHLWQVVMFVHRPGPGRAFFAPLSLGLLTLADQNACWLGLIDALYIAVSLVWPIPGDRVRRVWGIACLGGCLLFLPIAGVLFASPSKDPSRTWPISEYQQLRIKPGLYLSGWAKQTLAYWELASAVAPEPVDLAGDPNVTSEPDWMIKIPLADKLIEYRPSQLRLFNLSVGLVTAAAALSLIVIRATRPAGLWLAAVVMYLQTKTWVVGDMTFTERLRAEPLVFIILLVSISVLAISPPNSQSKKKEASP